MVQRERKDEGVREEGGQREGDRGRGTEGGRGGERKKRGRREGVNKIPAHQKCGGLHYLMLK